MRVLPKPEVILTHESDLDGFVSEVRSLAPRARVVLPGYAEPISVAPSETRRDTHVS